MGDLQVLTMYLVAASTLLPQIVCLQVEQLLIKLKRRATPSKDLAILTAEALRKVPIFCHLLFSLASSWLYFFRLSRPWKVTIRRKCWRKSVPLEGIWFLHGCSQDWNVDWTFNIHRKLIAAAPSELVVGNIVRRILFIVREEYATLSQVIDLE